MSNESFYIGWQERSPSDLSKHSRKVIAILVVVVLLAGLILAWLQRPFDSGVFEYGKPTRVKGIYQDFPVPSIRVMSKADAFGKDIHITMPLVGYGKFGAEGIIRSLEKKEGILFNGKELELNGTFIFHDGKTLLQIDEFDTPLVSVKENNSRLILEEMKLGSMKLTGEVLDPKCYFGVMKPGHGKPHRDCATRCIEGGISPVFFMRDEKGNVHYALLLDEHGMPVNKWIGEFVAEPISLEAEMTQYNDWLVLYIKKESIKRTGGLSLFKKSDVISCGPPTN